MLKGLRSYAFSHMLRGMQDFNSIKNWLDSERGRWPAIAAEAGVSYNWITRIMQGRIADPGTVRLSALASVMRKERRRAKRKPISSLTQQSTSPDC